MDEFIVFIMGVLAGFVVGLAIGIAITSSNAEADCVEFGIVKLHGEMYTCSLFENTKLEDEG